MFRNDTTGTEIEVDYREEIVRLSTGLKVRVAKKRDIGFVK